MTDQVVHVGPYVVGEKQAPLEYQYLDSAGVPIDLTGYTAKFVFRERDSASAITANAVVTNPTSGKVTYTWTGTEFTTSGHWMAEFWVGNLAQRWCSWLILFDVRNSLGAVPSI